MRERSRSGDGQDPPPVGEVARRAGGGAFSASADVLQLAATPPSVGFADTSPTGGGSSIQPTVARRPRPTGVRRLLNASSRPTPMRRFAPLLSVLALAPMLAAAAPRAVEVDVRQAWARPVAGAGMNSAGYMVLANRGRTPITLTGASSPLARELIVHRTTQKDGVSSMRAMGQGLVIPPGGQVAFAPGGNHFMIMGLKRPLKPGERLALTLAFDGGRKVEAQMAVRTAPPQPAAAVAPVQPHRH
ncbi:hypothetical protein CFHF_16330 [Caulobacter flavus]|uniref:Copper chaperone PCu(A)C n=2 Tax=Caulobacter flavus TaxID=1679497 RepID=A0A2N5CR79_9CAUL|nr:hypothetical protein C1707_07565 [Caulobacter flavus]PLR11227.1 hypothetical protein CFHF_16330 [Caulobacter flavus]